MNDTFPNVAWDPVDFSDRWGSVYWAPGLSIVVRCFLTSSSLMLFWIFDGLFWQSPLFSGLPFQRFP